MSSLRYVIQNIYDAYDRDPYAITYEQMIMEVHETMENDTISAKLICDIYDSIVELDEESFSDYCDSNNSRKYDSFFDDEEYEEYVFGTNGSDLDFVELNGD